MRRPIPVPYGARGDAGRPTAYQLIRRPAQIRQGGWTARIEGVGVNQSVRLSRLFRSHSYCAFVGLHISPISNFEANAMKGDQETVNFAPVVRLREGLEAMCGIELCGLCGFAQE